MINTVTPLAPKAPLKGWPVRFGSPQPEAVQQTFLALKPDAFERKLMGTILQRFEAEGFKPLAIKMMQVSRRRAAQHYREHKGKPFYEKLLNYFTSGPVLAMVWEGPNIIQRARTIIGATRDPAPGTIRATLGADPTYNLVHSADSPESARREIALFFNHRERAAWEGKASR